MFDFLSNRCNSCCCNFKTKVRLWWFSRRDSVKAGFILNHKVFYNAEQWAASIFTHNQRRCSATKRSCRAFTDDQRIMRHESETLLKFNFFQLVERRCSWGSILLSICWLDAHDLKNGNGHAREWWKTASAVSMNPALLTTTMPMAWIWQKHF